MNDYRRRANWTLGLLACAILLAYVIPYGLLRDYPAWQGAFLFWTLFGGVSIGLIFRLVAGWRP